jgi:alkylhydroperoxidase/carboxymuconolactone decarboxylase family protein YurZ
MMPGEENPYDLFMRECPTVSGRFNDLVDAQRALPGLDPKTRQLINIAIQTSTRNPRGVFFHAGMARSAGASRDEVIGAVVMNLHLSGLAAVLDSLPAAVKGYAAETYPGKH